MNNQSYLDEMEDFLAEAAENHRMYPSDRVWRNVSKTIQPGYKWPALTFVAILIGALYMLTILFVHPDRDLWSPEARSNVLATATTKQNTKPVITTVPEPGLTNAGNNSIGTKPTITVPLAVTETSEEFDDAPAANDIGSAPSVNSSLQLLSVPAGYLSELLPTADVPDFSSLLENYTINISSLDRKTIVVKASAAGQSLAKTPAMSAIGSRDADQVDAAISTPLRSIGNTTSKRPDVSPGEPQTELAQNAAAIDVDNLMVQNIAARKLPKQSPWAIRFYATPSVSYRTYFDNKGIGDDQNSNQLHGPIAPNWINSVNMFVRQKPMIGFEAGTALSYSISHNVKVRVGLQANYRQFAAEAFRGQSEVALILLENNGNVDSIFTTTSLVNQTGKAPVTLTNRFVELAVPIGFDVEVASGRIGSLYISGSLQPTYTVHSKGYLLSTDYSRYVDRQDLFRSFNVNSSLEAYLQIPGNGVQWQIGPQIRYQASPGTVQGYGVRQHLVDYGMKIGVMKTLRR